MITPNQTAPLVVVDTAMVNQAYIHAITQAGGIPMLLPNLQAPEDADSLLRQCDGFLLTGGPDVDPHFYQEAPLRQIGYFNREMDAAWIHMTTYAVNNHKPIFGICRGMQAVNVALGGTLYQDLQDGYPNHQLHAQKQNRADLVHKVQIQPISLLANILGCEELYTNTLHHQCVKDAGKGLRITAATQDGVPEAMENDDGTILLVQWHPEELLVSEPRMGRLFSHLIKLAQT